MLNFLQSFLYYLQVDVIEPASQRLQSSLRKGVISVDDIIFLHNDFLDSCVKDCILSDAKILQNITNLLSVCTLFANFTKRFFATSLKKALDEIHADEYVDRQLNDDDDEDLLIKLADIAASNRFDETVEKFEQSFEAHFKQLTEMLGGFSAGMEDFHMFASRLRSAYSI